METKQPICPALEEYEAPHQWEQIGFWHDDGHGTIDLVRCVRCLAYLEVIRPCAERQVVDADKQESDEPTDPAHTVGPDAFPGMRVVYQFPENGYEGDRLLAQANLEQGADYTVETVEVCSWRTMLTFEEVHGRYNSVLFEELI